MMGGLFLIPKEKGSGRGNDLPKKEFCFKLEKLF